MISFIYLFMLGIASFVLGRFLPQKWFDYGRFPFKSFSFEAEGHIYEKLKIRKWKEKLPDMSRIVPEWMPDKRLPRNPEPKKVEEMIQETCVAECIHTILCFFGFGSFLMNRNAKNFVLSALFFVGNIPFIFIQRYNRPKLVRILRKMRETDSKAGG